jgi:hypothetical protein
MKKIINSLLMLLIVSFQDTSAMDTSGKSLETNYNRKRFQELEVIYKSALDEIEWVLKNFPTNIEKAKKETIPASLAEEYRIKYNKSKEDLEMEKYLDYIKSGYWNYTDTIQENYEYLNKMREDNEKEHSLASIINKASKDISINPQKFYEETVNEALNFGMSKQELIQTIEQLIKMFNDIIIKARYMST